MHRIVTWASLFPRVPLTQTWLWRGRTFLFTLSVRSQETHTQSFYTQEHKTNGQVHKVVVISHNEEYRLTYRKASVLSR